MLRGGLFLALTYRFPSAIAAGASSFKREATSLASSDILVATPGRLVDHVRVTPHFSLADVRYLVLDESDRLLNDA